MRELGNLDREGRGLLDLNTFIQYFTQNAPQQTKFTHNDLLFLANKYVTKANPNIVDVNVFLSDFTMLRKNKQIIQGFYQGMHQINQANILGQNQPLGQQDYNTGHRNPLLPQSSATNTRADILRTPKPPQFGINTDPRNIEDIARGTYIREQLVEEYFKAFGQQQNRGLLQAGDFARAIQMLDLGWTNMTTEQVFNAIDETMHYRRKSGVLNPQEIDECVAFGCNRKIDQIQQDILGIIAKFINQQGINIRRELADQDPHNQRSLRVEDFKGFLLNKVRVPQIMPFDCVFLAKKYIQALPNLVLYDRFIDDIEQVSRGGSQSQGFGNQKLVLEYIKKAALCQRMTVDTMIQRWSMQQRDIVTKDEFQRGCGQIGIIPEAVTIDDIEKTYREIDINGMGKVSVAQVANQVQKFVPKEMREFQDEILEDIIIKARGKSLVIDNLFRSDDPNGRGVVQIQIFCVVFQRQLHIKEIDMRVLAQRYIEGNQDMVNYQTFIRDFKNKDLMVGAQQPGIKPSMGLSAGQPGSNVQQRLKALLQKLGEYCEKNNIQLYSQFSYFEQGQSSGAIPQSKFLQVLEMLKAPLPNDDKFFISESYLVPNTNPPSVNYLRILEDIKLYASQAPKIALTKDQQDLLSGFAANLKKTNKVGVLVDAIQEKDFNRKGYLPRAVIEEILMRHGYKLSTKQFNVLFSTMDTNHQNEHNYKQLIEHLLGSADAQKVLMGGRLQKEQQTATFVMPQQPIGAKSAILANIGKKLIQSNINYEEEFRRKIGAEKAVSQNPKVTDNDVVEVLTQCKVLLTNDERIGLESFIMTMKDSYGMIPLLEFLQAIGLTAQTLGPRGVKQLPRKILNPQELLQAQEIVNKLRDEITKLGKKPVDFFAKWKTQTSDLSLPVMRFKMALAELGQVGQAVTDQQLQLLTYYLTQEVPNEISLEKLRLACTLTSRDPPLQQQGAEEIKNYEKNIRSQMQKGAPLEIIDFAYFLKQSGLQFAQVFKQTQKGQISRQEFETCLKDAGYQPKDPQKLVELLDPSGKRMFVSLDRLNDYLRKTSTESRNITPQIARDRYQSFDPKVRHYLQKISEYLKRSNITLTRMYEEMDVNKDGTVDKQEFVNRLSYLQIPGVQLSDLGMIFDALDINNDQSLSVNEFGMFIEGVAKSRQERSQDIDPKLLEDMKREIQTLFAQFDENRDGYVTADEIVKSLMALGQRITLEDAKQMIAQVDNNGDGKLDQREFVDLMLPKMKDELLNQEDSLQDLRALFLDADIDHSGTLSVDEIYSVMLKLGAEVTVEELVELMNEIDIDRDGTLDIDEFIALMSLGDEVQFKSATSQKTLHHIKKARKLNPLDFFKNFKNMPSNFVPSFFTEQWVKKKKNLPSSVFVPQIDPKTMLYKDLYPVLKENINPAFPQLEFQPRVRPLITELGCQILLEECQGVPLPEGGGKGGFDRTQIVKRMVRIGLYDTVKKDFVHNSVQVNALYNQVDEDIWKFNAWKDNGTNPVLFKTSNKDDIVKPNIFVVFELVVAVRFGEKITEMSCGWCQLDSALLDKPMTHKLAIKGGSPNAEMLIKDQDVHTNRTGLKYIMKVMQSKIESQLTISLRPHQKFTDETKLHLDLLPSTCFIQKRLLYFVSGFRNYIGEKLLKESSMHQFMHPEGDVIISCFPKILDNPDICEQIITIWSEDVWSQLNARQKTSVQLIMDKTKEFIRKLYPVIYAEEFKFKQSDYTFSAAGDQYLMRKREELIKSALRFGNPQAKVKVDKPIETMTSFKPFTVRELEFEVWDTHSSKQERFLRQYEEIGLLNSSASQHASFVGNDRQVLGNFNQQTFNQQVNQQLQQQPNIQQFHR